MEHSLMYVGLDYHQDSVQVCAMNQAGQILANRPCANDWQAIGRVIGPHRGLVRAALEACSGAADLAEELVARAGWSVDLAHPGYVARIKQSPDKSDFSDAQLLSDLERVGYLPRVWLAPQPVRELRHLVRYRQGVAEERRKLKLRVRGLLRDQRLRAPEGVKPWSRCWLGWLRLQAPLSEQGRWVIERLLARLEAAQRGDRGHGGAPEGVDGRGSAGPAVAGAEGHRAGDGRHLARRGGPFRPFPLGQATVALLRPVAAQCFQRQTAGRRRTD